MLDSYTFNCQIHPEELEKEYEALKEFMEECANEQENV